MSSLDSTLPQNTTLVHPPFFFLTGYQNIPDVKYYYVFLCFVFMVSVLGNSFVMFFIYTESSRHTPKYMAVFNLAIADLGSSTALIPNVAATFLFGSQFISFDACLAHMFFVFCFNLTQSVILTVMAYDRMVAICLPLRYHAIITMPAMAVIFTVVWAFNILYTVSLVALVTRLSFCKSIVVNSYFCDHAIILVMACNSIRTNIYVAIVGEILFLYLPLILIVLSYVFIVFALFKISSWEGRFKAIKTCSAHLMLVALHYLPYIVIFIAQFSRFIHPNSWMIVSSLSDVFRPMLDPIIYVLNTDEAKEWLKKNIFKRKEKPTTEIN